MKKKSLYLNALNIYYGILKKMDYRANLGNKKKGNPETDFLSI